MRVTVEYKKLVDEAIIRTEDGGVALIYHNGEHFTTDYFQSRCFLPEIDWDKLAEGKGQYKDWPEDIEQINEEMIKDALDWLVFPNNVKFEISEHLNTKTPHIAVEPKSEKV